MSIRSDHEEWADKRKEGFKKYFIEQLAKWVKISIQMYVFFALILIVFDTLENGFDPPFMLELLKISLIMPAMLIIFSLLIIYPSWRERENRYKKFLLEKEKSPTPAEVPVDLVEKTFSQYRLIRFLSHSVLILPASAIIFALIGSLLEFQYTMYIIGIMGIPFFIIMILLVKYFKNPICQHKIFSVDEDKRHPDSDGSFAENVLKIIKKNELDCFECNGKFYVYEKNGKLQIVKKG